MHVWFSSFEGFGRFLESNINHEFFDADLKQKCLVIIVIVRQCVSYGALNGFTDRLLAHFYGKLYASWPCKT